MWLCFFCQAIFQVCSLFFVFNCFIMHLDLNLLEFILFWFCRALGYVNYWIFSQILELLRHYFFKYSFCPFLSLFAFLEYSYAYVDIIEGFLQVSEILLFFSNQFSFCSLGWIISIDLSSSSLILFFLITTLLRYNLHITVNPKYTVQWFLVYSQSSTTIAIINFRIFFIIEK